MEAKKRSRVVCDATIYRENECPDTDWQPMKMPDKSINLIEGVSIAYVPVGLGFGNEKIVTL